MASSSLFGLDSLQSFFSLHPTIFLIIAAGGLILAASVAFSYVITARPRAEAKVTELVAAYNAVTEKLNEAEKIGHFGSFMWDFKDTKESFWSEEMFELFGLVKRPTPPTADVFVQSSHKTDHDRVAQIWKKAYDEPGAFTFDFQAVAPSGQVRHLRVQGKTLVSAKLKPYRIQGIVHDITKEMQVDRAKSEFVSLASHQLKTPLTSIKWLSEVLLREDGEVLTATQHKYIEGIHTASRHMVDIVNDLLNVSRIELGTLQLKNDEIDIRELIEDVVEEQRHAADIKHVMVVLTIADGLPKLVADKNLVRMIFQNLISNAIKYSRDNGKVECELSFVSGTHDTLFMRVTDSGIGIPEDERDNVFKKLYRAKNAQLLVPDGTGLGLYVIKTILERVHGGISFESKEGVGTTFYASLPFVWGDVEKRP